jgi:hypothetical protein
LRVDSDQDEKPHPGQIVSSWSEIVVPPELLGAVIELSSDSEESDTEAPDVLSFPPRFDQSLYIRTPDRYTIVYDDQFNLPALGIVINTLFRSIICIKCAYGVQVSCLERHLRAHLKIVDIPENLGDTLEVKYKIVAHKDIEYFSKPVPPVFGVDIYENPYIFCGTCHRGYQDLATLKAHKSNRKRCAKGDNGPNYTGYGQCINEGSHRRIFRVDVTKLVRKDQVRPDYLSIFKATHPPPTDFSKLPMRSPEDEQNLSQFFSREGWLTFVDGYTGDEIVEACRGSNPDEPLGVALKAAARRYIGKVQPIIQMGHGFGFVKSVAQISPS